MQAVLFNAGGPDGIYLGSAPIPKLQPKEILIKVYATAVNRADCLQRQGKYPVPPGVTDILGLEASGTVELVGDAVTKWKIGERVMALLSGGGYSEFASVHEDHVMRIPEELTFVEAAAIPEAWLTAYQLLHFVGHVTSGDTVLVHAAASGVGTSLIQMACLAGAKVIATAGSRDKLTLVESLGASSAFDYHDNNLSEKILNVTSGKGVNLILDCVGASMFEKNFASIAIDGRWVIYGSLGGTHIAEDVFGKILRKRISVTGTTLRPRSIEYKSQLVESFTRDILPLIASRKLQLIIDTVLPLSQTAEAHNLMEANKNKGKIILRVVDNEQKSEL